MTSTLEDTIYQPRAIIMAVFCYTNKVPEKELQENTLTLLLQEMTRPPDKVLLTSEGNSSIYIQDWAESLGIKTQTFHADWTRNGKGAQIIREDRMYKECTHALIFLSQRSDRLEKFAERMARKGKIVFTSSYNQTLTQFEMSNCEHSRPASKPAHKSDKGIMQMWQKYQRKEEC